MKEAPDTSLREEAANVEIGAGVRQTAMEEFKMWGCRGQSVARTRKGMVDYEFQRGKRMHKNARMSKV